jgi:hypothetical protein
MNYETHIFSQMHSIVTNAIATGTECRTFNQLADKLNEYGITNAKDKSFTGGTLQKYIHRKSHPKGYSRVLTPEMERLRDLYLPEQEEQKSIYDFMTDEPETDEPSKSELNLDRFTHAVIGEMRYV